MKLLEPKAKFDRVTDISIEFLKENDIRGVILDVDNTLIDLNKEKIEGVDDWIQSLKDNNIKIFLASNSAKLKKIKRIADSFGVEFTYSSFKPLKKGLKKGLKYLDLPNSNVAEIGDQLFTDVVGANRLKLFSILTKPIEEEKSFPFRIRRKLEKLVLNKGKLNCI